MSRIELAVSFSITPTKQLNSFCSVLSDRPPPTPLLAAGQCDGNLWTTSAANTLRIISFVFPRGYFRRQKYNVWMS